MGNEGSGLITSGGLRKLCTDAKRCGMGSICEHAQHREQSVELISLFKDHGEGSQGGCDNYFPRTELGSVGDVPRNIRRHNAHAPKAGTEKPSSLILPPHLQQPPDLMVSRHIKKGHDIKGDD